MAVVVVERNEGKESPSLTLEGKVREERMKIVILSFFLFKIQLSMEVPSRLRTVFLLFSSSSAINAQTLSGTGRGGRLLITIILIILLFFLSVCRAHVVRVATKTKRSE